MEGRQLESSVGGELGRRLRAERKAHKLTQREFAELGGVGLGAQHRYEAGTGYPDADYLLRVARIGVDAGWVLTGVRNGADLTADQSSLLEAFNDLRPVDRAVLLRLAASLTDRPAAPDLVALPSTDVLTAALQAFLEATPGLAADELVHELATQLPTILRAAEDELPAPASALSADESEDHPADDAANRATRRKRNS